MSLIWTESFSSFSVGGVDTHSDLVAADYIVKSSNDAEWHIKSDMVVPNRYVASPTIYEGGGGAIIGRSLPAYTAPFVIGFSVYVPAQYERPSLDSDPVLIFRSNNGVEHQEGEIFRLRRDLHVSKAEESPQNISKMTPARVHYLEVKISLGGIMVWMDDVFVLQHTEVDFSPLFWSIEITESGFDIGNLYVINEDDVYPNNRLGRATRVVGDRPTEDKDVDFERPVNYESNAKVAGQDFVAEPPAVLQGLSIGDRDIYKTGANVIESSSMIHAVSVKTRAMNADTVPRSVSGLVESGGSVGVGLSGVAFHQVKLFTNDDILCATSAPGGGVVVGTKKGQIWLSRDGERFDGVAQSVDEASITAMVTRFNSVVAVCDNGRVIKGDFNHAPPKWRSIQTPTSLALRGVAANSSRIIAVGDSGVAIASESGGPGSWEKLNTGVSGNLTGIDYAGDHWITAGSLIDGSLRVSLNNGDTWLDAGITAPPVEGPVKIFTAKGKTVIFGSGPTPIASRSYAVGHGAPFYAAKGSWGDDLSCEGVVFSGGIFTFFMSDGSTLVSEDALALYVSQDLSINPRSAVSFNDGLTMLVGDGGVSFVRKRSSQSSTLPVLGGYVNGFSPVYANPHNGKEWDPEEASLSNIGVQINRVPVYGYEGRFLLAESGFRVLNQSGGKILLEEKTNE